MRVSLPYRWLLALLLVLVMAAGAIPPAQANTDLKAQLEQAQRELDEVRRKQRETQNALANVVFQAQEAQAQLRLVEGELVQANSQLSVLTEQLTMTTAELEQVEAELKVAQALYDQKQALLGSRIRAIRENGRVDYLAVLLGSASFRDFIGRLDMLNMIVKKDRQLFDSIKADKLALEEKQRDVSTRKNRLANLKVDAEQKRSTIVAKRNEREAVSRSLEANKRSLEARLGEYEQHTEKLASQIADLVRQMNRQAGRFAPIPPVRRPVTITDPYGMRDHPILGGRRMHWGVDFAVRRGDPVYAIEDGVVIVARWDDVFGNLIVIDHGGGITSWYAHSDSMLVKVNEAVKQGQQIARAGSTGWSTGPHVHLEVHVDGQKKNPLDYINL